MSHTPAPWSIPHFATAKDEQDCDCTYVLADGYFGAVCSVHINNGKRVSEGGNDCPPLDEAKANARLIAAAPDLLAALHTSLAVIGSLAPDHPPNAYVAKHEAIIRAAIAKAKG